MTVYAGKGDPRRSMGLLWRASAPREPAHRPGPRPGLDVDTIVGAATAVADAHGMAGLSMRAVGERLGRTAMALYTYVANKDELIGLMYDRALGELPDRYPDEADWRTAATAWAVDLRELYVRHPWLLDVSQARPGLGPNEHAVLETIVRILAHSGLAAPPIVRTAGALFQFTRAMAQVIADARQAPTATGQTDDEWWYARSAALTEVAPDFADRFPTLTRMSAEHAFEMADPTVPYLEAEALESFDAGIATLLAGVPNRRR